MNDVLHQLGDPGALADSYLSAVPLVPAPYGRRIAAKLIDVLLFLAGFAGVLIASYATAATFDREELLWLVFTPGIILFSLAFVIYVIAAESLAGQTLGKQLFQLRVVRESGARIGLGQSIVRQLPWVFQVFWIDALFALFTDQRQRAFELLSKTRVIDAAQWDAAMPPEASGDTNTGAPPA